jgi:hypothetical protein
MRKMLYFVQDFNKIRGWSTHMEDYQKFALATAAGNPNIYK